MIAFLAVVLLLPVAFLLGFREGRLSLYRKHIGEALVIQAIHRLRPRPYYLFNNVTLATPDGSAQIDHILVEPCGIFVIETKHYGGWIFGNPAKREWQQVFFKKKIKIRNPLFQNHGHVEALKKLFNLPDSFFHSLVVFTGDADLKTEMGDRVVQLNDLGAYFSRSRPTVLDERKMTYIVGRIEMARLPRSDESDEYHVNAIRNRIQSA
jgi:restriction system protein